MDTESMVTRVEALRMLGIGRLTWVQWEREGRVRGGRLVVSAGGGRRTLYPLDKIQRLVVKHRERFEPYPDPQRAGVYRVPLKSRVHRMEAIIDAESLPLVKGKRWNWSLCGNHGGVVSLADATRPMPLRRIIMGVTGPGWRISHLNGDPLDCRRANLIVRSISEQLFGTRKMGSVIGREYTSRFKGVSWDSQTGKWQVQITANGKHRKVGRFHDEIAAAEAYDEAARTLFGEHARLNFPEDVPVDPPITAPPMREAA